MALLRTSSPPTDHRALRRTLIVIASFQFVVGAAFLVAPTATADLLGLAPAPNWTSWLFTMMAARFLGFGVAMVAAARDPQRHQLLIDVMAGIQAIDWVSTIAHLAAGNVTLGQVTTASFVPVLFVIALVRWRPRATTAQPAA